MRASSHSSFRWHYWSFYPLLVLLIGFSGWLLVHIGDERESLIAAQNSLSRQYLPAVESLNQLRQWMDDWVIGHYRFTAKGNKEELLSQSAYYLEKITETLQHLPEQGIAATDINQLHEHIQRMALATKSLENAITQKNSELPQRILTTLQNELNQTHLLFKNWQEKILQPYHQTILEYQKKLQTLSYWLTFHALLVIAICIYLLLRLMFRWLGDSQLIHQLHHQDELDLPNLRQLRMDFDKLLAESSRPQAVLFRLKLSGVAEHTRIFGTHVGILAQKSITRRFIATIKNPQTLTEVYYLSENEWAFLLVLPPATSAGERTKWIQSFVKTLMDDIEKPVVLKNLTLRYSGKIGASVYPDPANTLHLLLQQSELALSTLTNTSNFEDGNMESPISPRFALYNTSMPSAIEERIALAGHLRSSLSHSHIEGMNSESFQLMFQPRFSATNQKKWSISADIFWRHHNQLYPRAHFSPVAEASGLAVDIGDWAIQQGLKQWRAWHERWLGQGVAEHRLALPIYPRQLTDRDFPFHLNEWLTNYQIKPSLLVLEIAGSWAGINEEERNSALKAIRAVGVHMALGDFGHSDLALPILPQLGLQGLIIHANFVEQMETAMQSSQATLASDHNAQVLNAQHSLARLILNMGKNLNLTTTAVGIATPAQASLLTLWGCDHLQGNLFAPLMSARQFSDWVDDYTQPF